MTTVSVYDSCKRDKEALEAGTIQKIAVLHSQILCTVYYIIF